MDELERFDYDLPRELIAQEPLACRSDARLMVVDRRQGTWTHAHVRDLAEYLRPTDLLVVNDSRVVPARLDGYRIRTRGKWQGLFLDVDGLGTWRMLCKTRGRMEPGELIRLIDRDAREDITLRMVARLEEGMWAARPESIDGRPVEAANEPPWELLQRVGRIPLPHYIRGGLMVDADARWYQTVYADRLGSVAAPTAGLHFTKPLLQELALRGIGQVRVTLHVGAGTFRPIQTDRLADHVMHEEWGEITEATADRLNAVRAAQGRIVAVGTTTVRVLESAAHEGRLQAWSGKTSLFIRPPYRFQAVDALMTNFHLPRSTLLVLVSAFAGTDLIRQAYAEAIREEYRFFSYGDAMLIV